MTANPPWESPTESDGQKIKLRPARWIPNRDMTTNSFLKFPYSGATPGREEYALENAPEMRSWIRPSPRFTISSLLYSFRRSKELYIVLLGFSLLCFTAHSFISSELDLKHRHISLTSFCKLEVNSSEGTMPGATQKVAVIQDASREISSSALEWALTGLKLEPGDELTLLAVLHQVNTPMGYKSKVGSSSIFGASNAVVKEAVQRKKEEYENNEDLIQINELYESKQVNFSVLVVPASSPKIVAMEAVKSLGATWIILDRHMKKDKKYFLEKLSCGISRMKSNNSIEQLRGPKIRGSNNIYREGSKNNLVTYEEMLPGNPEDEDLFSLELSPKYSKSLTKNQRRDTKASTDNDKESLNASDIPKSSSRENLSSAYSSPNKINLGSILSMSRESKRSPLSPSQGANSKDRGLALGSHEKNRMENVERKPATSHNEKGATDDECFQIALSEDQPNESLDDFACSCGNARPKIEWKKDFKYSELRVATERFSKKNFLSEGGFGFVYKGELMNGQKIAVKQYKPASLQGEREFKKEVDVLSKARHKNLVMLLGSCSEGNQRLLVYEFVCNGSLDQHLSGRSTEVVSWPDRLKIALGAAKGLQYLHSNNIIHRDMRPNNILVTHDYEPMLGDFGLARTQCEGPDHSSDSRVVGTIGYLAPEYAETGKVSKKMDVYSFGVVLLELLTGRSTTDQGIEEGSLVGWARPLLKERKYPELMDPMILDSCDVHLHELFWMVRVAEKCLSRDPEKRLHMDKVVYVLECVKNGQNYIDIEDFSPPPSDLMSGKWDKNEAREREDSVPTEKVKDKAEESEQGSGVTVDEMVLPRPSSAPSSSRSSNASTNYESSSSSSRGSKKTKRRSRSQSVHYGEMLI
ncbi:hypothetical protein H6P81_007881 [Aristolochia fimbriata]|uniref:Protein kinase domain-containing protein n=1 Tax=Aristolochia fimbriata TaxID=158543 RepID=A0AAV7F4S5_ARIFI|nr:hypothetical protein H6P81_007881 [Aristolochia fimbriata]